LIKTNRGREAGNCERDGLGWRQVKRAGIMDVELENRCTVTLYRGFESPLATTALRQTALYFIKTIMNTEVRLATPDDIPFLEEVERSASAAFHVLSDYVPNERTVPSETLVGMASAQKLWVAVTDEDKLVGFIGCRIIDNLFYIHEISVAYDFQKQGIGRHLMLTALQAARRAGYAAAGLTTRRDAIWNMPFYKSLGFTEVSNDQNWPMLFIQLQKEIAEGAAPSMRCAMIKNLAT
jgi:ribosomal protein S18 acetylase RimI-like enzyme